MATTSIPALDHLVHHVTDLDDAIATYSALGFLVIRGGTHADQITTNALIVLPDGVYLELIAFVKPEDAVKVTGESHGEFIKRRNAHWWYNRKDGWIDIALLGGATDGRSAAITESSAAPVTYVKPQDGGRKTLTGKQLEWKVTFPASEHARGTVPFFCEDVTPREWRVPENSSPHPNHASGVVGVTLMVAPENFQSATDMWRLILNNEPHPDPKDGQSDFKNPGTVLDGEEAVQLAMKTPSGGHINVKVKRAQDPQEEHWVQTYGEGVFELEIGGEQVVGPASS